MPNCDFLVHHNERIPAKASKISPIKPHNQKFTKLKRKLFIIGIFQSFITLTFAACAVGKTHQLFVCVARSFVGKCQVVYKPRNLDNRLDWEMRFVRNWVQGKVKGTISVQVPQWLHFVFT